MILLGAAGALLIGGMIYLNIRADEIVPERTEITIPLPDAFSEATEATP